MSQLRQVLSYVLTSGVAALVNLCSRVFYSQWMHFNWAVVCAYFTGMLVNFALSSIFVFSWYRGGRPFNILIKFSLVAIAGLIVTVIVSEISRQCLLWLAWFPVSYTELAAHAMGIGIAFFASFAGHSLFTYRQTGMIAAIKRLFS